MCGILGFSWQDKSLALKMLEQIKHRGPDDQGIYTDSAVTLGNVRLAVRDLSPRGHMPMVDQTKRYIITYNGEIYNSTEIKRKLLKKGYRFRSETDTEVLLNSYIEYGPKAFLINNGMFACAIWDKQDKKLILARDKVGIKPLYYAHYGNKLIFASEINPLHLAMPYKQLNQKALENYLQLLYVPAPQTMFEGINKLEPGHYLVWHKQKITTKQYWSPQLQKPFDSVETATPIIKDTIYKAIDSQLVSDRTVGVFLSGGIDSSLVMTTISQILGKSLQTFTIKFDQVAQLEKFNADADLAKRLARDLGTDHCEITLTPHRALQELQHIGQQLDEPIGNATLIPTAVLAQESIGHITVALGGDGGDEVFAGYPRYFLARKLKLWWYLPRAIRKRALDIIKHIRPLTPMQVRLLMAETLAQKYASLMSQTIPEKLLLKPSGDVANHLENLRGFDQAHIAFEVLMPLLDTQHWLAEESLMRADKMTMLASLEQRVPLLDDRVVDLGLKIPLSWKLDTAIQGKNILREVFKDQLPEYILTAQKRGFFSPGAKWLRDPEWQKLVRHHFSPKVLKKQSLFNSEVIQRLLEDHLETKAYHAQILIAVLFFQLWHESQMS